MAGEQRVRDVYIQYDKNGDLVDKKRLFHLFRKLRSEI